MKKQSAVQWLVEQVNSDCLNSAFIRPELVKQANKMFEEQISEAFINGEVSRDRIDADEYYKETYGGNK
jgi:hypothetical protein